MPAFSARRWPDQRTTKFSLSLLLAKFVLVSPTSTFGSTRTRKGLAASLNSAAPAKYSPTMPGSVAGSAAGTDAAGINSAAAARAAAQSERVIGCRTKGLLPETEWMDASVPRSVAGARAVATRAVADEGTSKRDWGVVRGGPSLTR